MSNTGMIIEERSRDIGGFLVGRLLPFREKRMVGPFIYIDHMGPVETGEDEAFDVDQHPHIGLSTLTYLFEGEVMHRDSLGTVQHISPGSVNWMTAGSGVTHTERTPDALRGKKHRMHGFQIWVALPQHLEDTAPGFQHVPAQDLPKWEENGLSFVLVAGSAYERKSPLAVHSPMFMLEIKALQNGSFSAEGLEGEIGVCIVEGSVETCGETLAKGQMLVAKDQESCRFDVAQGTHILVFGGQPFPEGRQIFWNFVSSDTAKIEAAAKRWQDKDFPQVPHDDTYIPMPVLPKGLKVSSKQR